MGIFSIDEKQNIEYQTLIYTDFIVSVYNNSWIETTNYQFVKVYNSDQLLQFSDFMGEGKDLKKYVGKEILVLEKRKISDKAMVAEVKIIL